MTFKTNIPTWLKSLLATPTRSSRLAIAAAVALLAGAGSASAQTATCTNAGATTAHKWKRWECVLEVASIGPSLAGRNPYQAQLKVTYSRGSLSQTGYAAWDGVNPANGKHRFLLRQMFPSSGIWTFNTSCDSTTSGICGANTSSPALHGATGTIYVGTAMGANEVYQYGQLKVRNQHWYENNEFRTYGSLGQTGSVAEFPWVGDSAWAAPMKATTAEWDAYLTNRAGKGVTVVHIGPAPYWAGTTDTPDPGQSANTPFVGSGCSGVQPTSCQTPNMNFWRRFEGKIEAANQKGLHVFLAGLMEPVGGPSGSRYPTTQEAVYFARWLAARLAGNHVIFSPGFDSPYQANLHKPVGAAIKAVAPKHLVTNHWNTTSVSTYTNLHSEPWLDFEMVQSGHNNGNITSVLQRARELPWQVSGASNPGVSPFVYNRKPTVNGEAIYDQGGAGQTTAFNSTRARQAGYLSWLSGSFGYTWGLGGLWDWGICGGSSSNICGYQMASGYRSYDQALNQAVNNHIKNFSQLLRTRISFGRIKRMDVYEQNRILNQAPDSEQHKKMVIARNPEWILAYLPFNQNIRFRYSGNNTINVNTARWWNPRNGTVELINPADRVCNAVECTINNAYYNGDVTTSDRILIVNASPPTTAVTTHTENFEVLSYKTANANPMSIFGQLIDAAGLPVGAPVPLFSSPGLDAYDPAVGRSGNGKFFVAFQVDSDADGRSEIWGTWHTISGPAPEGKTFRISPVDDYSHFDPAVAVDASGKVVVSWTQIGSEEAISEVVARQVGFLSFGNASGTELGTFQKLCSDPTVACYNSKAVANSQGKISIAWVEEDDTTSDFRVVYQPFSDTYLLPLTVPQQVNSTQDVGFWLSNLHSDNSGGITVEYEGRFGDRSAGLFQQDFSASGLKVGGEVAVSPPYPES